MSKRNKIFIISGPSGVGKDTVIKKFSEVNTDVDIITTVTTRKIRKNEKDKIDYIFVNEKEFKKLIESNKLIEL
jgi:guanylate kinase